MRSLLPRQFSFIAEVSNGFIRLVARHSDATPKCQLSYGEHLTVPPRAVFPLQSFQFLDKLHSIEWTQHQCIIVTSITP